VHEARVAFLASFGLSELDFGGASLIMGDTAIVYQGEAFAADNLRFEVSAGDLSPLGFRLFYKVTRVGDGSAIALVENGMVCFDYQTKQTVKIPASVHESGFFGGEG
jgi:acyl-CoA thioester hydrolase